MRGRGRQIEAGAGALDGALDGTLDEAGVREGFELLAADVAFPETGALSGVDRARRRPPLSLVEDHLPDRGLLLSRGGEAVAAPGAPV